ncbi:hypothetical protein KAR28_03105 [Candidatus Parcubacteria bacterium]|nr:hypothetical protein [Candidatus Parcubacteria bacterium]
MEFFKFLQPKDTIKKAKNEETVISTENEDKKWIEDNKIKLDELADKLNGQEEKDEDDVFNYESLLDQHLKEKQKELTSNIEAMEKAKPSAVADFGSGKAEANFDKLMQELMNNPNADHGAILEEVEKEEDLRHNISNMKADIELGLSGNLERYKFLEKADILPDTIKEHEGNFKLPSMELLADQYTQALNESSDKSEDEIKKYKEDITNQLNYIIASGQAENKLDNDEQGMLKAVYSEKYQIEPIIAKELDGNIQYIKDSGMSLDDVKDITAEDIEKAEQEIKEKGFNFKEHLRKHSGRYAAALVLVAVVLGQAEVLAHPTGFDDMSGNQDDKENNEPSQSKHDTPNTDNKNAAGVESKGDEVEDKKIESETEKPAAIDSSAVVDKGEGVSHAIARQLIGVDKNYSELRAGDFEVNQDHLEKMGYEGDMDDKAAIMDWAQGKAGKIVMQEGYYDTEENKQTWVMEEGKSAYVLSGDKDSGFHIDEYHDRDSDGEFEPNEKEDEDRGSRDIDKPYEKEHEITEKVAEPKAKTVDESKTNINKLIHDVDKHISEIGESGEKEKIENEYDDLKNYNELQTKRAAGLSDKEFDAISNETVESLLEHADNEQSDFPSDGILGKREFARQSALANIIRSYSLSENDKQISIKDFVSRMNDDGSVLRTLPDSEAAPGFFMRIKKQALEDHYLENDRNEYNRIRNLHNLKFSMREYNAIRDVRTGDLYEDIINRIPGLSEISDDRINAFAQKYFNSTSFRTNLPHAGMYNLGEFQKHCCLAKMIYTSLEGNNIAPSQVKDIKIGYIISRIDKGRSLNEKFLDSVTSEDKGKSAGPKIEVGGKEDMEKGRSEEVDLSGKNKQNKEEIPL